MKADKTTNYYKTAPEDYMRLVNKNVTKTYKKTNPNVPDIITLEDKKIAEKIELADRIEVSASRDSFITLKDHSQISLTTRPADSLFQANLKLVSSAKTS